MASEQQVTSGSDRAEKRRNKKANQDLLKRVRKRYAAMSNWDQENRTKGLEDMRFVNIPGEQWDAVIKEQRGKDRPCYEFNKIRISSKRVINDMRDNRPSGKVRPVEGGDKQTADTYAGVIRNIWNVSDGDTIIDSAAEYQVNAGFGAWRVDTKYTTDTVDAGPMDSGAFNQEITLRGIPNPFCLLWDTAAKDPLKRDAQDWIVTDKYTEDAFDSRWPKAEKIDFEDNEFDDQDDWSFEEGSVKMVRVVEYWYKELQRKQLLLLQDGAVVDAEAPDGKTILATQPERIKRKREVMCPKIKMCIASGDAILEKADWAGSQFPFVVVFGEYVIIDGKHYWWGLPRFGKDAQRAYNVGRTAIIERLAKAPIFTWWATPEQAAGMTDMWTEAHRRLYPWMIYNPDPKSPGPPVSEAGPSVEPGLTQECMMASDEIKATTGIFDASLGAQSNEQSGKAINARTLQGEIATFNFRDNMTKAVRRTWEIMIDLIPKVYDTERELRIIGQDGAEDYVKVNQFVTAQDGVTQIKINDLGKGRYDVAVTSGPSYATQRQEASEIYSDIATTNPALMQAAGDLIVKALDLPFSEEIAERLKMMLPPPIQEMIQKGKKLPPEVLMGMAQVQQKMQEVEQQGLLVQQAAEEAGEQKADAEKALSDLQVAKAELKAEQARFEAAVAKALAKLQVAQAQDQAAQQQAQGQAEADRISQEAQLDQAFTQRTAEAEKAETSAQVAQAVAEINASAAEAMRKMAETFLKHAEKKISDQGGKVVITERKGGKLISRIAEESETGST